MFKFAVIADAQYSDEADFKECRYRLSKHKLQEAVETINGLNPDFTVQLGDFINQDFDSFSEVLPILNKLQNTCYSVLGNHDLCVEDAKKRSVWKTLGMPYKYYAKNQDGWKLLFLDGNDISLNAWPEGSENYLAAQKYFDSLDSESEQWNGAIGSTQMQWLVNELAMAQKQNCPVLIFCHFPIFPESRFSLWNSSVLLGLVRKYPVVKAWMTGHHHVGGYAFESGIHFMTFKGMVETEENSFASVEVKENVIEITGFGREESRVLKL